MNLRTFLATPKPKRSDNPVVARGQVAWEHLKEDAPTRRALLRGPGVKAKERREQSQNNHRRWWCEVGEALAAGKRMSKTSHEYYAWLNANGFGDMPRPARGAAVWFATHVEALGELPDGLASPGVIRQWANKRAAELNSVADESALNSVDARAIADLLKDTARDVRRIAQALDEAARSIDKASRAIKRLGKREAAG